MQEMLMKLQHYVEVAILKQITIVFTGFDILKILSIFGMVGDRG